jgi:hypothetical protein
MRRDGLNRREGDIRGFDLDRRANLAALFASVRTIFDVTSGGQRGSVFTSDYYALDGGTGKVSDFVDYIDNTHTLHQGTSAQQAAVPATDANLRGAKSTTFANQWYDSTRAASLWKYLHDGTGMTIINVFVPNTASNGFYSVCGTVSGLNIDTGVGLYHRWLHGATRTVYLYVSRASATRTVSAQVASLATLGQNVGSVTDCSYQEATSPEYNVRIANVSVVSGSSAAAPSAANPDATLRLGADVLGGQPAAMRWRATLLAPKTLSAAERAAVYAWILADTGIAT